MDHEESELRLDDSDELDYMDAEMDSDSDESVDLDDFIERNHRLRHEFDRLQEELQVEESRAAQEFELSRQLEENRKRLQAEIAELELTRRKLMAEKLFWDFIANFPEYDHWSDFFNKNRFIG